MRSHWLQMALVAAVAVSCTSSPEPKPSVTEPVTKDTTPPTPVPEPVPVRSREESFVLDQISNDSDFTLEDERYVMAFPAAPPPGSWQEAALSLGLMKIVIKRNLRQKQFQENELLQDPGRNNENGKSPVSLEALSFEKKLDLMHAMQDNPHLQNLVVYKTCLNALKVSNNSLAYTTGINQIIATNLRRWNQDPNAPTAGGLIDAGGPKIQVTELDWSKLNETNTDIRIADQILIEVQLLADNHRFSEALLKIGQITSDSPLYSQAQQKTISISDQAVQELRRKAALAFQSSVPVSDPKARVAYLNQARAHLEQALRDFPKAPPEQISTVKENLAVISHDLEKLSTD